MAKIRKEKISNRASFFALAFRNPRGSAKKSRAKKSLANLKNRRRFFYLLAAFVTACFVSLGISLFCMPVVKEARSYSVANGSSISSVADDFDQGILFKIAIMSLGGEVIAGEYDIPENISVFSFAKMLAKGRVASTTIVIPEGYTILQIRKVLEQNKFLKGDFRVCSEKECEDAVNLNYIDGDLFPDTYTVAKGSDRLSVIKLMAEKMARIKSGCSQIAVNLPAPLKDWNDVITLASIVQKETSRVSEMPIVASVYLNRLRTRMRLQADPTVVYFITGGLGDMNEKKLYSKYLKKNSVFNTYTNYGLPPRPIANVGLDAIKAVLNPADTNYYYFVADGSGGHKFSETLQEHNKHRVIWNAGKNGKSGHPTLTNDK